MYSANRLRKTARNVQKQQQKQLQKTKPTSTYSHSQSQTSQSFHDKRTKAPNINSHTAAKQKQYQQYYQLSKNNPDGLIWTSSLFPHSVDMSSKFGLPAGVVLSPMLALSNQAQIIQKSADNILRCASCRAYMNCYNSLDKKKFTCFICNRDTMLDKNYIHNQDQHNQLSSSVYQALGSSNFYQKQPVQQVYIFLVDISQQSYNSKMLYFMVAALKQVLSRTQLDDICIYFYTFDQLVHEYDFSGEEVRCNIIDSNISNISESKSLINQFLYLKNIRGKLFGLLDQLQQISQQNYRKGYNFSKCFRDVFTRMKLVEGKFFIFQSNQSLSTEHMFVQPLPNNKDLELSINSTKTQSFFETKNRQFFQLYTEQILKNYCSISFFCFSRNYKNLRVMSDSLKLSNSELKLYLKDSQTDLNKFYYDLTYLLGATYFKNVVTQLIISAGWQFTGIYGNSFRLKQTISFQINWLQMSKKFVIIVTPSKASSISPFCGIQMITNYRYKKQSFISIATMVQPVTGYLDRLYASIDIQGTTSALARKFLSALRMQQIKVARQKFQQANSKFYNCALQQYKKYQNFPDSIISILLSTLGMLKSIHSQPQFILNTLVFDRIIVQRNFLQFSGIQIATFFNPYLFSLSQIDENLCKQVNFQYPPSVQLLFQNVREGLFLLDNGLSLFLFIAKLCSSDILMDVFGKEKLTRHDLLNEQILMEQTTHKAIQIQNLIKYLRNQKTENWAPLYIVRCGENTLNQKLFYLNFYSQKYQQYKLFKLTLGQYIETISKFKQS